MRALGRGLAKVLKLALKVSLAGGVLFLLWGTRQMLGDVLLPLAAMLALGAVLYHGARVWAARHDLCR